MKGLPRMEYANPGTLEEALDFLSTYGEESRLIAGGTDLIPSLQENSAGVRRLVDLWGLRESLGRAVIENGVLNIGALATLSRIASLSSGLLAGSPLSVLSDAASLMGCEQTRSLGTVAGNLAAAVPSADMAPPLMALDAVAVLRSASGERKVAVKDLFAGPKKSRISQDEILTEILVPSLPAGSACVFGKFGRRKALTLAIVNVAVKAEPAGTNGGGAPLVKNVRIALGAVAPTPMRAFETESWLDGKQLTDSVVSEAGARCAGESRPISDIRASEWYRRELVAVLVERALREIRTRIAGSS
ncbi:MAG: FAD binding domain-containing protein [Ignavibacteriales bacterium]